MRTWFAFIIAGSVGVLAGCGSGDDDDDGSPAAIDCNTDTTTYDDVAMFDKCVMCHSSALTGHAARHEAPANINFDMSTSAIAIGKSAVPEVMAGVMPPPSSGIKVSDTEKQKFYAWVQCGLKP